MKETNMEHSAEWYRGAVAVIGRMVDECQTVFDSDLPHITQGNLEDYLAEYAELLAAAEAREAALEKHEIAAYLEWQGKDGIKCGTFQPSEEGPREPTYTTTVREWRKLVARAEAREAGEPSAAEVIRVAKAALTDIRAAVATSSGQCGVLGTNWAECDYCGAVSQERMTPIPHEKGCAFAVTTAVIAEITAWETPLPSPPEVVG